MIEKAEEPIEFEVSMGNYGNKFDNETQASSATTEPIHATFGGTKIFVQLENTAIISLSLLGTYYYYVPWGAKKPVVCVTSQWEDIGFRYHGLNVLLRIISNIVSIQYICGTVFTYAMMSSRVFVSSCPSYCDIKFSGQYLQTFPLM